MNASTQTAKVPEGRSRPLPLLRFPLDRRWEMRLWLTALALGNLGLLRGAVAGHLIFLPQDVAAGQWWRLLTWPFIHVSPYHLLLDGAAFLMLYAGLEESRCAIRLTYVAAAAAGSLLLPLWLSPEISTIGLCGLSGIAHGLMALTGWELLFGPERHRALRRIGGLLLAGVAGKAVLELTTGQALFAGWHPGDIGRPIVATHLGGVLGGLAPALLFTSRLRPRTIPPAHQRHIHSGNIDHTENVQQKSRLVNAKESSGLSLHP